MKPINSVIVVSAIATVISGVPARAYEEGPVEKGGTIQGKVIFNGAVETRKIIPNKDLDVCDGPREEPLIDVGPDKGVENAVVYLAQVAKGKAWPAQAGQAKTPELVNHNCRYRGTFQSDSIRRHDGHRSDLSGKMAARVFRIYLLSQ